MTIPELEEQLRQREAQIKEQAARIKELEREIEELKKLLVEKAKSKEAKPPKEATNYSVDRHERKRRKRRRRKKSTGRRPKDVKRDLATQTIDLYWYGADRKTCVLRREQFVWRLIDGKAQYVHYRIFDEPESTDLPPVDGVRNGKCEYGLEILITLAYLVYWTGLSIDKACGILAFFTGLELSKAQADSLLSQLAADWQIEYDAIAELVVAAAILYIDETGWKVGKRSCYTWIFSTLSSVLFKCGVGRGKAVLTDVLGEHFDGIGVTDDYSAYQSQFTEHQLCWAHFLRKAIALSLRNPDNRQYKRFLKSLFAIYYDAVRFSRDRRLSAGRQAKVNKLQSRIRMICRRYGEELDDAGPADDAKFVRLQNELVDNTEKLFVFVLHPEVEATNNRSERQARSEAMARKAARTSKTEKGAKRRGVIMSVLASLSKRLEHFTLDSVLSEINHWFATGRSVFQEELAKYKAATAATSRAPP
ncbi:MAG: transposase [bacterium]|nr:transposase [bacterium]